MALKNWKHRALLSSVLLYFGSEGAITLYTLTSSLLLKYVIFILFTLCVRHIIIHILKPNKKRR